MDKPENVAIWQKLQLYRPTEMKAVQALLDLQYHPSARAPEAAAEVLTQLASQQCSTWPDI